MREELPLLDTSLRCLEYVCGMTVLPPLPLPEPNLLLPPLFPLLPPLTKLEVKEVLVSEEHLGKSMVEDLGRSVGADLVRLLNVVDLLSVRRTIELEPTGLKKFGNSLLVELLPLLLWVFGGRPRGARTGDKTGLFPPLRGNEGETTAAAAAIRDSPELPWRSMLLMSASGGRA